MKGAVSELKELMEKSTEQGMQTFDQALYKLYKEGRISLEEALKNADSKNNLRLKITLDENPAGAAAVEAEMAEEEAAAAAAQPQNEPMKTEAPKAGPLDGLSLVDLDQ